MKTKIATMSIMAVVAALAASPDARAAGLLHPTCQTDSPLQIRDHEVRVVINNGFAETEVTQTFYNPNGQDLEAVYSFPLPESASLSEMTIWAGERELQGEVLPRDRAERVYEEEKSGGNDAGLATKHGFQRFEFRVTPVRAVSETRVRFVYYQPIDVDTGVGRYLYPMEEGGTDDAADSFWTAHSKVEGQLHLSVELRLATPIAEVRTPGFQGAAATGTDGDGDKTVTLTLDDASLDRDFVLYYRLDENLPGRVDVLTYKKDAETPGTFMLVASPGIDLQPITRGSDHVFVLDVSGSMAGKIHTLTHGVAKTLGQMRPEDRFRIVTFSNSARELTAGWQAATPEVVARWVEEVGALRTGGSTDVYEGLRLAFRGLDDDRAAGIVLVTDGVTNTGIVDVPEFYKLSRKHDVRVFGFLMGNSANWPLMKAVCDGSGGFYDSVSNADDIVGKILLAKSKVTHECLHDATLKIRGVKTYDTSDGVLGKVYRGEQLALFGRYAEGGRAKIRLDARLTGEDKTYETEFEFPDVDASHPEIERLWALDQIEQIERRADRGEATSGESAQAIADLGVAYQLVTDETAMVVLDDEAFAGRGIERRNQRRVATERQAKAVRATQPRSSTHADAQRPMFPDRRPSLGGGGGGGGAIGPIGALALAALGALAALAGRSGNRRRTAR